MRKPTQKRSKCFPPVTSSSCQEELQRPSALVRLLLEGWKTSELVAAVGCGFTLPERTNPFPVTRVKGPRMDCGCQHQGVSVAGGFITQVPVSGMSPKSESQAGNAEKGGWA